MQELFAIFVLVCVVAAAKGLGVPAWAASPCGLRGMVVMDDACMNPEPRPVDFRLVPERKRPQKRLV